jgi:hypothetical protein
VTKLAHVSKISYEFEKYDEASKISKPRTHGRNGTKPVHL